MPARPEDLTVPIGLHMGRDDLLVPLHVAVQALHVHMLMTGASGWGKTMAMAGLLCSLLRVYRTAARQRTLLHLFVLDAKNDLCPLLRDTLFPAMYARFGFPRPDEILCIDPFGPYPVQLNPLIPIPGMEAGVQAHIVSELISRLTTGVGIRMNSILMNLALAELSLASVGEKPSLANILRMLCDPENARARGARIADPSLRRYVLEEFPHENKVSIEALASRFRFVLLIPVIDAVFNADSCITGADLIDRYPIVLATTAGAPAGLLAIDKLIQTWVITVAQHGVFGRDVRDDTPHAILAYDEWQRAIDHSPDGPDGFERLLSLARFKRFSFILANQTLGQLHGHPVLLESLKTNVATHVAFRPDAAAGDLDHILPLLTSGRRIDPRRPDRLLSESEERALVIKELSSLPKRWALLANRLTGQTDLIRTLKIDVPKAERSVASLPPETRESFRRGCLGIPREELIASRKAEEASAAPTRQPPASEAIPVRSDARRRSKLVLP